MNLTGAVLLGEPKIPDVPLDQRDPHRRFSRAEVIRKWEAQGRKCPPCQRELPRDLFDGDHVFPWSKGGRTVYSNLMALCRHCNARKGNQTYETLAKQFNLDLLAAGDDRLRHWQEQALDKILPRILNDPVLIEACPGAGKTRLALEVAHHLIKAGEISRVLVVVHTIGIADGWLLAASKREPDNPTLPLVSTRGAIWRPTRAIPDNAVGAVLSYQSLARMTDTFLAHATDISIEKKGRTTTNVHHNTLVIFDEVHHVATDKTWGLAAQTAFAQGARCILSMSGTPFRTDAKKIAFVPHTGGAAKPLYRYTYGHALRDKPPACRRVQFLTTQGSTTFRNEDGTEHTLDFNDPDVSTLGKKRRLLTALDCIGDGTITDQLIHKANDWLIDIRDNGDPDAAGLVVCYDCDHAERIAKRLEKITGIKPMKAWSKDTNPDDQNAADVIRQFKAHHASKRWLVAVNMISEGIDIRRLRAVVYLTNTKTKLAFRQIVGRVMRIDPNDPTNIGRIYMPADPDLISMAERIRREVPLLPPLTVIEGEPANPPVVKVRGAPKPRVRFEPLGTVAELGDAYDTQGGYGTVKLIECAELYIEDQRQRGKLVTVDATTLALAASRNKRLRERLLAYQDQYHVAS
jgi:superfamily II DNA or RNA helicase